MRVLRNYAYTDNLLLQQTYRESHLTKRTWQNNGELSQYHIMDSHDAIIHLRQFNAVQKKFTVDFLQKSMNVNEGEVPQYYVENSHPAIIEPEEWDLVQAEFSRRKALGSRHSSASMFSSMFFCGDCGLVYGLKVWHSTSKYRRTIWQCNDKFRGDHCCTTPHLYEKDIKEIVRVGIRKADY